MGAHGVGEGIQAGVEGSAVGGEQAGEELGDAGLVVDGDVHPAVLGAALGAVHGVGVASPDLGVDGLLRGVERGGVVRAGEQLTQCGVQSGPHVGGDDRRSAGGDQAHHRKAEQSVGEQGFQVGEAFAEGGRDEQGRRHRAGGVSLGGADVGADRGPVIDAPLVAVGGSVGAHGGLEHGPHGGEAVGAGGVLDAGPECDGGGAAGAVRLGHQVVEHMFDSTVARRPPTAPIPHLWMNRRLCTTPAATPKVSVPHGKPRRLERRVRASWEPYPRGTTSCAGAESRAGRRVAQVRTPRTQRRRRGGTGAESRVRKRRGGRQAARAHPQP